MWAGTHTKAAADNPRRGTRYASPHPSSRRTQQSRHPPGVRAVESAVRAVNGACDDETTERRRRTPCCSSTCQRETHGLLPKEQLDSARTAEDAAKNTEETLQRAQENIEPAKKAVIKCPDSDRRSKSARQTAPRRLSQHATSRTTDSTSNHHQASTHGIDLHATSMTSHFVVTSVTLAQMFFQTFSHV